METTIHIGIDVILFLIASYFLFYKSFLKELGKQNAQLTTIEEKTKKIEEVKQAFTKDLEEIKAELQKNNLSYQINMSELTKRRFDRIDALYVDLINLQNYVSQNMFHYNNEEDFQIKVSEFKKLYEVADISRHKCSLYISDELKRNIIEVLNNANNAFILFCGFYRSDTRKLEGVSIFNIQKQELLDILSEKKINYLDTLDKEINKLPELLNKLENELKRQIILKDLD
jgi:hypothetical protein